MSRRGCIAVAALLLVGGCAFRHAPSTVQSDAQLAPQTPVTRDLLNLPAPKGKVTVAVYGIRDQTG